MVNTFPKTTREWHWHVFNLSWPIILSTLSVPLVGLVDTAVVGRLDDAKYIAAVAMGAVIFSSVFWVFGFLRMGTTGFVAQAWGRSDETEVTQSFQRAAILAIVFGVIVMCLQFPIGYVAFSLMNAGTNVQILAQEYFDIRVWSAPATFINYVILGCLIGMQRMRLALVLQLVLNVTNIILDVFFVMGLGALAAGVAWASVISEYVACLLGLYFLRRYLRITGSFSNSMAVLFNRQALRRLMSVNVNLFVRTFFLTGAFFFFTAQGSQLGTVVLAANAILIHLLQVIAYGLDGFAHAAEALAGGAFGAKKRREFVKAVSITTQWALIVAILFSVFYAFAGQWIIQLMTTIPEVIEMANRYLGWIILAPLVAVWSYQLDGVYIGVTETRIMRNTVMLALVVYVVLTWWMLPIGGNHALWACLMLFLLLRGAGLAYYYPRLLARLE